MIAKLSGTVDSSGEDWLVIDVGGVGYLIFCSARTLAGLPPVGGQCSFMIETHVREDHIHLYGFADAIERAWFRLLTTVQGIGAKVALGILSALAPETLAHAIAANDGAALTQAPGVGKKLATRVISELKDKVGGVDLDLSSAGSNAAAAPDMAAGNGGRASADAVSALVNLGYGRAESFGAVASAARGLGEDAAVEALIRDSLASLSGQEAAR